MHIYKVLHIQYIVEKEEERREKVVAREVLVYCIIGLDWIG